MSMLKQSAVFYLLISIPVILFCTSPQNPYSNPDNAKIQADSSLAALKDTLKISTEYKCTVNVFLPNLVDSFFVRL
jgi:MFS-type transporter involved in bile tolerance (Atg22 family)